MSNDQTIRLISAVAQLLGVLIWPAVVVFFFVWFRNGLNGFMTNLSEFSFKTPGVEATARRAQVEAAAAIGAAAASHAQSDGAPVEVADLGDVSEALPDSRVQRRLRGSRILWVDDRPDNNIFERRALAALGIKIDLSTSTVDALEMISKRPYDLIISDMGRPSDARAGYTLLDSLRNTGNKSPFVIYSGSRAPEHVREARQHGAIGATNSPKELVRIVTQSLPPGA